MSADVHIQVNECIFQRDTKALTIQKTIFKIILFVLNSFRFTDLVTSQPVLMQSHREFDHSAGYFRMHLLECNATHATRNRFEHMPNEKRNWLHCI